MEASVMIENIKNGYLVTIYTGSENKMYLPTKDEMIDFIKKHF